ncbi:hypothetical protein llap_18228 [Limosa lapponica baueri]|uniref:Uncharacterized protein n=1 Tax=Limosa lapponica baueri TaxID=1758121 RepID=A0A2I0TCE5_LIMLA|nr:hypothetical protein llap_18228 [Limosa lapponica baueri]
MGSQHSPARFDSFVFSSIALHPSSLAIGAESTNAYGWGEEVGFYLNFRELNTSQSSFLMQRLQTLFPEREDAVMEVDVQVGSMSTKKGMNKEIFKFTDDTELFWMAKGCVDGKEFQKDLTRLRGIEEKTKEDITEACKTMKEVGKVSMKL